MPRYLNTVIYERNITDLDLHVNTYFMFLKLYCYTLAFSMVIQYSKEKVFARKHNHICNKCMYC